MPHWHCTECHHEWEGSKKKKRCDWCNASGYVLEDATPLEMSIRDLNEQGVESFLDILKDEGRRV